VRQGGLRQQERAADVDVHHQVELLGRQFVGRFGRDGAGVVDHDVDAAEVLDRSVHGVLNVLFLAHVPDHRDALASPWRDRGVVGQGGVGHRAVVDVSGAVVVVGHGVDRDRVVTGAADEVVARTGKRAIPQFVINGEWIQPYRPGEGFLYQEMSELLRVPEP